MTALSTVQAPGPPRRHRATRSRWDSRWRVPSVPLTSGCCATVAASCLGLGLGLTPHLLPRVRLRSRTPHGLQAFRRQRPAHQAPTPRHRAPPVPVSHGHKPRPRSRPALAPALSRKVDRSPLPGRTPCRCAGHRRDGQRRPAATRRQPAMGTQPWRRAPDPSAPIRPGSLEIQPLERADSRGGRRQRPRLQDASPPPSPRPPARHRQAAATSRHRIALRGGASRSRALPAAAPPAQGWTESATAGATSCPAPAPGSRRRPARPDGRCAARP